MTEGLLGSNMVSRRDAWVKCEIIIDPGCEERIVIYAREVNGLTEEIKRLAEGSCGEILGYRDREIVKLDPSEIYCISIIESRVYAVCEKEELQLKQRLYMLEGELPHNFVKINQSCIANLDKIDRFDASIAGTLKVHFKNGHTDYVSRRQLKAIKERMGI